MVHFSCRMAPKTRGRHRKEPQVEYPESLNHMEETPSPGELLNAMKEMMTLMAQHKEEMSAHKNSVNERQTTPTPPPLQPESSSRMSGLSMTEKLSKFKKFAPVPFKEAKSPTEAEEWLDELENILEVLKIEEEDKIPFTEFLLHGEARAWWKMEKKIH